MSLDSIVKVTITSKTRGVTRKGFGVPLIAGFHTKFGERVRSYNGLTALEADGFVATDPIHRAATALLGASNKVPLFKVGRLALAWDQLGRLTPTKTDEGLVVSAKVTNPTGTAVVISHTNGAAETVAAIVTDLQTQLTALAGITATDDVTHVSYAADVSGERWYFDELLGGLELLGETADPGIATDLGAIYSEDIEWYGLLLDLDHELIANEAATFIEARELIYGASISDTQVRDSAVTTDIMSDFKAAQVFRSYAIYSGDDSGFAAARWMGELFPLDPGSATWAFKTLSGIVADKLAADGSDVNIEAKNGNHYQIVNGRGVTLQGVMGSGEFIDVTRGRDWLKARMQERVFDLLSSAKKVPFTDAGVDLIRNAVEAQLQEGISAGFLAATPVPVVTVPLVADVSSTDKANRLLPDVEFSATIAGAIHAVEIDGVISV